MFVLLGASRRSPATVIGDQLTENLASFQMLQRNPLTHLFEVPIQRLDAVMLCMKYRIPASERRYATDSGTIKGAVGVARDHTARADTLAKIEGPFSVLVKTERK